MLLGIATIAVGSVIVTEALLTHPFTSVTCRVLTPAPKLLAVRLVLPLFHRYVYGLPPPVTWPMAIPLLAPPQVILVELEIVTVNKVLGSLTVMAMLFSQLLASFTVTV